MTRLSWAQALIKPSLDILHHQQPLGSCATPIPFVVGSNSFALYSTTDTISAGCADPLYYTNFG